MSLLVLARALAATTAAALAAPGAHVAGSRHDFTGTGGGETRGVAELNPCAFCHGSHATGPGLTSRPESASPSLPYGSATMASRPASPTGSSRTCLSCHDGTVAVGSTRQREIPVSGSGRITPGKRAYLGTDLRGSHPVSVPLQRGRKLRAPSPADEVRLDGAQLVQCTSCHDPHREHGDPLVGKFLVKPSQRSAICLSCHDATSYEPAGSTHGSAAAAAPPPMGGGAALPMSDAGCMACHLTHGAAPDTSLVARGPRGDDDSACLRCHGTGTTRAPIGAMLARPYSHAQAGRHDPAEGPDHRSSRLPESSPGASRHVTCVDCHDPHAATSAPAQPPFASGALAGVWGIDLAGARVETVRFEYEVCFKCHADSANKPQSAVDTVRRAVEDRNLRRVFSPAAASSHPVAGPARNHEVPSLMAPLAQGSTITCSDCHGAEDGLARGPHGSSLPHILRREYRTGDLSAESPGAYALCYGCHDREVLLSNGSAFPLHRRHVVDSASPCSACHSAHGVSLESGDAIRNAHLIDFDTSIVKPDASRRLEFRDLGSRHGSCNLDCHGHPHAASTY